MTQIFNYNRDSYFKIGKYVPDDAVNVSYFEVPDITPRNNITVINEALNISNNINTKFHIENELVPNLNNVLEKKVNKSGEPTEVILGKKSEGDNRFRQFLFPNHPIREVEIGKQIRFCRLNISSDGNYSDFEDITNKVDVVDFYAGTVTFKNDIVEGNTPATKARNLSLVDIQARFIEPKQPQLFSSENIAVSDIEIDVDERTKAAVFYKYELKYLHQDLKKKEEGDDLNNVDIEEIRRNIKVLYSNEDEVSPLSLPYQINIKRTEEIIRDTFELYEVEILFSFNPNIDEFYVKYNPEPNVFINNYLEIIDAEKIYRRVDQKDFYEKKDDELVYTTEEVENGYHILVSDSAQIATSPYDRINGYMGSPDIPFNYEVTIKSRETGEHKGIEVLFLVDNSGYINGDIDEYSNRKEAMQEFIEKFQNKMEEDIDNQEGSDIEAIYKICEFNKKVGEIEKLENNFELESNNELETYLNEGINKVIDSDFGKEKNGYKKTIIILSSGRRDEPFGPDMYRYIRESIQIDGVIDDIWCFSFGVESQSTNQIDDHLKQLAFDVRQFRNIINESTLEDYCQEAVFFTAPFPKAYTALTGSTTVNKFNPAHLGYIDNMFTSRLTDSEAKIEVDISQFTGDKKLFVNIYEEIVEHNDTISKNKLNDIFESYATINTENEEARYYVEITSEYTEVLNSKTYYIQEDSELAQISVSIDGDLSKHDNWYFNIDNGSFKTSDLFQTYHYSIPEFRFEDFSGDEKRIGTMSNGVADKIDSHTVKTEIPNLHIKTKTLDLDKRHGFVKTDFDITDGSYEITVPENVKLYDDDGTEYTVINWNKEDGILKTLEYISDDILNIDYEFLANQYIYQGYFDENGDFIHLDLNPRKGHTYIEKDIFTGDLIERPSSNLYDETIYIYIIPENVLGNDDRVVADSRSQFTLFHTIGEELVVNKNRPLPPYIRSHIQNGHFSLDEVLLLAKIYINPISNPELIDMTDTRTRGGGIKEEFVEEMREINPMVDGYFDIGQFDGKIYPNNGVVVVDIPEEVLDDLSKEEVEEKINKHFPLGGLPIIRYV